jgi:hypothetical protein
MRAALFIRTVTEQGTGLPAFPARMAAGGVDQRLKWVPTPPPVVDTVVLFHIITSINNSPGITTYRNSGPQSPPALG